MLLKRFGQCFALSCYTAAQNDNIRSEDIGHIGKTFAQMIYIFVYYFLGCCVACFGAFESSFATCFFYIAFYKIPHLAVGIFLHYFFGQSYKRSCGCVSFKTVFPAASTRIALAAYFDMSYFC